MQETRRVSARSACSIGRFDCVGSRCSFYLFCMNYDALIPDFYLTRMLTVHASCQRCTVSEN